VDFQIMQILFRSAFWLYTAFASSNVIKRDGQAWIFGKIFLKYANSFSFRLSIKGAAIWNIRGGNSYYNSF